MNELLITADITVKLVKDRFSVVCLLPENLPDKSILTVVRMNNEKRNVMFGNPQQSFDFDEPVSPAQQQRVSGTIGPDGVVETVNAPAEPEDEDDLQEEMSFGDDSEEEFEDPFGDTEDDPLDADMDFFPDAEDFDEPPVFVQEERERDQGFPADDMSERQVLENYIIAHKPKFSGITFDFPTIIQRKRQLNMRWTDVAKEQGVTSGVLQKQWSDYKKLVEEQRGSAS